MTPFPPDDPVLRAFEAQFGPEFGHSRGYGLDGVRAALSALGDPHSRLPPVIHIAGTNGKGSTAAFVRAIAEAAGLRVQAFTQPHLMRLSERFVIAGAACADADLIAAAQAVAAVAPDISQFEAQTVTAFRLMAQTPADLAVIEVGCGGLLDATNVARPAVSVITPIAMDHVALLGPTLADIAGHKAGIIKAGCPVICAAQAADAEAVVRAAAERVGAPLWIEGQDFQAFTTSTGIGLQTETMFLDLPAPRMLGAHQVSNAGVAAMALLALDEPRITPDAIAVGIATAQAPGRMQPLTGAIARLAEGRPVLLDGGHNPHGANAIAAAVQSRWSGRAVAVIGMLADKDVEAFVAALAPALSTVVAVAVRGPRPSAPPERIAAAARAASLPAQTADSLPDAVRQAALITPPAAPILICGSFALAGEALCLD